MNFKEIISFSFHVTVQKYNVYFNIDENVYIVSSLSA